MINQKEPKIKSQTLFTFNAKLIERSLHNDNIKVVQLAGPLKC